MEAWRLKMEKMEPWRVYKQAVADSLEEELDPDLH
jgi:hypothetical protein